MECIKKEFVRTDENGRKWWRVILTSTEAPENLDELTGADVDGMDDNLRFAAGSVLLTPDGNSVLYADGWSEGGGGGGEEIAAGVQSITISPTITTNPTLASFFPIAWDDLTPDQQEGGLPITASTDAPLSSDVTYTITVTPGSEWYAWNAGESVWGERGEPTSWTLHAESGWLDFVTAVADNNTGTLEDPLFKTTILAVGIGND